MGCLERMKENQKPEGGRHESTWKRAGGRRLQTRSSPSAAWRIKHRGISHKGENMPIMAVLRTGGERDTDGQRGGIQVSK